MYIFLFVPLEGGDIGIYYVESLYLLFTPAMNYEGGVYMSTVTESKILV